MDRRSFLQLTALSSAAVLTGAHTATAAPAGVPEAVWRVLGIAHTQPPQRFIATGPARAIKLPAVCAGMGGFRGGVPMYSQEPEGAEVGAWRRVESVVLTDGLRGHRESGWLWVGDLEPPLRGRGMWRADLLPQLST